jgi:hypothetical protein
LYETPVEEQFMAVNWVEDIVSQLYKSRGYLVIEDQDLQMPIRDYRRVRGHSDIDVLAIKDKELVHIECQSWWGPALADESKEFRRLKDRFDHTADVIFDLYIFLNRSEMTVKNVLVTSGKPKKRTGNGPWDRLQKFCDNNEIQLVEINDIISELISELKKKYPKPNEVGKEAGIARFLIHLAHNDFLIGGD